MILPLLLALLQQPSDSILGRWEGTSICIKADWNASCHDEVTRYDFVRATGDTLTLHAYKQVNGTFESMGDLDFTYDSAAHRWRAEFANSRVHIEWSFQVVGGRLTGVVVDLPGRRKARDVVAHRVPAR